MERSVSGLFLWLLFIAGLTKANPIPIKNEDYLNLYMSDLCDIGETKRTIALRGANSSIILNALKEGERPPQSCTAQLILSTDSNSKMIIHIEQLHIPTPTSDGTCSNYLRLGTVAPLEYSTENTLVDECGTASGKTYVTVSEVLYIAWRSGEYVQHAQTKLPQDLIRDRIVADQNEAGPSFRLIITSYKEPQNGDCKFEDDDKIDEESDNINRTSKWYRCDTNRCIDSRWKCDNVNNCGKNWNEEVNCVSYEQGKLVTGLNIMQYIYICIGSVFLIAVIVAALACIVSRTKKSSGGKYNVSDRYNPKYEADSRTSQEMRPLNGGETQRRNDVDNSQSDNLESSEHYHRTQLRNDVDNNQSDNLESSEHYHPTQLRNDVDNNQSDNLESSEHYHRTNN